MSKDILSLINQTGILPTVSFNTVESAVETSQSLELQSLNIIEVMLRSDVSLTSIKAIRTRYPEFIIGAGTIKSIKDVIESKEAGADFFVLPYWIDEVIRYCIEQDYLVIPAVTNAKEIALADTYGLKCVKFFPAEPLGGTNTLNLFSGVFPNMKFIPTGGITTDNFKSYLKIPSVLAVGGGFMFDKEGFDEKSVKARSERLFKVLEMMFNFRIKHVGINMDMEYQALELSNKLSGIFGLNIKNGSKSYMVGDTFEVMKTPYYGEKGHIGIACDDVERAYHYLKHKGVEFIDETLAYDVFGKISVAYIADNFGGFAIHLMK